MMYTDFLYILNWWTTWLLIGIVSFPVTWLWLRPLWDSGYAFAKMLGLAVVGYVVWLAASIHLVKFSGGMLWFTLGMWTAINAWVAWKHKEELKELFLQQWGLWLRLEMLFLAGTAFWALIRGYQPEINGLEKFMDYGFVNSILRAEYFPPRDMWFAGGAINYYYFGHYLSAVIIAFSGIAPQVAYNLQIASLFGFALSGGVALGGGLINLLRERTDRVFSYRWIGVGGILTAFLLAIRGNLHWGAWQLNRIINGCFNIRWLLPLNSEVPFCATSSSWLPDATKDYWYPDATRYIPYTIHEFPMYSYVVADLHAHLINMNLVLVFLAGILAIATRKSIRWIDIGICGWLLGMFYMSNAWDLPIYLMVLGMTTILIGLKKHPLTHEVISSITSAGILLVGMVILALFMGRTETIPGVESSTVVQEESLLGQRFVWLLAVIIGGFLAYSGVRIWRDAENWDSAWQLGKNYVLKLMAAAALAVVVSLPFQLTFEQIAQGVEPVAAQSEKSKMWALWGWEVFLVVSLSLIVLRIMQLRKQMREVPLPRISRLLSTDLFVLGLFAIGFFLIVLPEFIYVKDIYIQEYHRANTMFKLVYQSWIIFSLASSYVIVRLCTLPNFVWRQKVVKYGWLVIVGMGLWVMGNYPIAAINSYYNSLNDYRGLDGEQWLAKKFDTSYDTQLSPKDPAISDEYAALLWLRQLEGQPVILEAVGDSYTEFNRFSAYSGLPSIEGWLVHEWLWRGSYDQPGRRAAEVEHIYTASTPEETKPAYQAPDLPAPRELLRRYNVEYVIVGEKEREKYTQLRESTVSQLSDLVFESGDTRIYKVKRERL